MAEKLECPKCGNSYGATYLDRHMNNCKGTKATSESELERTINAIADNLEIPQETQKEEIVEDEPDTSEIVETGHKLDPQNESLGIIGIFAMMIVVVLG